MGYCHMAWFLIFGELIDVQTKKIFGPSNFMFLIYKCGIWLKGLIFPDRDIGWSKKIQILWPRNGHIFCVWLIEMCHVFHYEHHGI
jgi:hypothetical protein